MNSNRYTLGNSSSPYAPIGGVLINFFYLRHIRWIELRRFKFTALAEKNSKVNRTFCRDRKGGKIRRS
jgi:hypothetical protein